MSVPVPINFFSRKDGEIVETKASVLIFTNDKAWPQNPLKKAQVQVEPNVLKITKHVCCGRRAPPAQRDEIHLECFAGGGEEPGCWQPGAALEATQGPLGRLSHPGYSRRHRALIYKQVKQHKVPYVIKKGVGFCRLYWYRFAASIGTEVKGHYCRAGFFGS